MRAAFRRLPPVARRDREIARLRAKVRELRDEAERVRDAFARRSSFQSRLHQARRLRRLGVPPTSVIQHGKFHVYDLARSHGIDVPAQYGRWDDLHDIAWSDLPDAVVIKSARGSHGRGVLPLRRSPGGWQVVGSAETTSEAELTALLARRVEHNDVRPPFAAEELLDEDGSGRLPTDVKVYTFYGEAHMVTLRRPGRLGEKPSLTPFRIVDPSGHDMANATTRSRVDTSLPVPAGLPDVIEAATRLSVAIRAPFARLDFYCIGDRVVFGEVTPRPGGSGWHGPEVDELLGDAWERAEVRLARDIAAGMPPEPQFGDQ
jgi:hypothetical protein